MSKFLCDGVTEAWIDFAYEGHSFTINDQFGAHWFFVPDRACPEALLRVVLEHFDQPGKFCPSDRLLASPRAAPTVPGAWA